MRSKEVARAAPLTESSGVSDNFKKRINLLGSTGSIGTQTLDIVRERPENFEVEALSAGSNVDMLVKQAKEFNPKLVCVRDEEKYDELKAALDDAGYDGEVVSGEEGTVEAARYGNADIVVTGIVGCAGLLPTIAAIKAGKDIALANKETLIAGGPVVLPLLEEHGVAMTPADSEHSAIFQCLQGKHDGALLHKIILTASGGAFRDWDPQDLHKVTVKDALKHPNWSMGAKITIDSATLMNKGLEVIEAHYLFGLDYDDIEIVVHPQSIIHSMVEFGDTSILAQLGWPDMRLPLLYSMSWPYRVKMPYERLDFVKVGSLTFREPDRKKYPCMDLAYAAGKHRGTSDPASGPRRGAKARKRRESWRARAQLCHPAQMQANVRGSDAETMFCFSPCPCGVGRKGGSMTAVLNAANEAAVELFREEKISYLQIPKVIEAVMEKHKSDWKAEPTLEDIVHFDSAARKHAKEFNAVLL